MAWTIRYHTLSVEKFVLKLPDGLFAKYLWLTDMMKEFGANLGLPHTRAMGSGLFELRVASREGIARIFFCTCVGEHIVLLHGFIKKTQSIPKTELARAKKLLSEIKSQ